MAVGILNYMWPYYFLYGMPPEPVDPSAGSSSSGIADAHWADDLSPGSFVDLLNDEGRWVSATVVEVSPTGTEVSVQCEGAAVEWLSVDSERLAPIGHNKKKHKSEGAAAAAAAAAAPVDDAWRARLVRGYMCDAQDSVRKWYQAVVVDSKDEDGVSTVKVMKALSENLYDGVID